MKKNITILITLLVFASVLASGLVLGTKLGTKETTAEITMPETTTQPIMLESTSRQGEVTELVSQSETEGTTKDLSEISIIDILPLSVGGGKWDAAHCQGMTVDMEKGYVYFSFTYEFVKTDFDGNVIGTIVGFPGHLGDIAYNEADGKVYGAYIAKGMRGFYVAVINVDKLIKNNVSYRNKNVVRSVFVRDAWDDYIADMNSDGKFDGNVAKTLDHRYGCGGIDGMTFAPSFVKGSKAKNLLTFGYGMYLNESRKDNDYQVLLQYGGVTKWWNQYGQQLQKTETHRIGPEKCYSKYFVYTGNIRFGTQTMTYDSHTKNLFFTCYQSRKSGFPGYSLYAINGELPAKNQAVKGNEKLGKQRILTLRAAGLSDKRTGIRGWNVSNGTMGMQSIGGGYFYICHAGLTMFNSDTAIAYLYKWTGNKSEPFELALS